MTVSMKKNYKTFVPSFLVVTVVVLVFGFFILAPKVEALTVALPIQEVALEHKDTPDVKRNGPLILPKARTGKATSVGFSGTTSGELSAQSFGPNLIANPSFEVSSTTATSWAKGGFGVNTRVFNFPVLGYQSTQAARVSITSYSSGDAKWYFTDVPVTPGKTYEYSNRFMSDIQSVLTARYTLSNGAFSYPNLLVLPVAPSWSLASVQFIVPPNVVSVTIFHLIKGVGNVTTDAHSLREVIEVSNQNLIANPGFEISNGVNPLSWLRGGWGLNTRMFTYPALGVEGGKAAEVSITNYTTGDAKWYFSPVAVTPGLYTYSNQYKSNVVSYLTAEFRPASGTVFYKDLGDVPPAANFTNASIDFSVPYGVATVTIYHLIKNVGGLTIDNTSLVKKSDFSGIFTTGAVSLTFDDGLLDQYNNALPKLESAGMKGTFFIVSELLADNGAQGFVSRAQISDIYSKGHEIGSHTRTHPHLSELTLEQQQNEIEGSRDDLLAMNVGPITSFAYPYGDYNATTVGIVQNSGLTNARSTWNGYAEQTSPKYELPRFSVENNVTIAQVKSWIDTAIANKKWLILALHGINNSGGQYATSTSTLNAIVDYLVLKNVPVVTMAEGMEDVE